MFFPFREEHELNNTPSGTYTEKLSHPGVLETINRNKRLCEPFGDAVEEAFVQFANNPRGLDPEGEQENDDIEEELRNNNNSNDDDEINSGSSASTIEPAISDEALSEMIRSLNSKQREIFEVMKNGLEII